MIKLLDILKEGIYGDYLFGGEDTGVNVGWYKDELEPDTPAEKELFDTIRKYVYPKKYIYSSKPLVSLDDYIPILKQLKQEYPEIVDPKLSPDTYIYRGVLNSELRDKVFNGPNKYAKYYNLYNNIEEPFYIIKNQSYSSRRKVSSWSISLESALNFGGSYIDGVIMRAKAGNAELFFNPKFIDKLNSYEEKEVFNITNPIRVDMLIRNKDLKTKYKND